MLRREAARWLARIEGEPDPAVDQEFRRWRDADPRHAEAFERAAHAYGKSALLSQSPIGRNRSLPMRAEPAFFRPQLAAAAVGGLALIFGAFLLVSSGTFLPRATLAVMLTTNVGEIKTTTLADGSKLTMDALSAVEVRFHGKERRARLKRGRIRLEIVPKEGPLVIDAEGIEVRSDGGTIDLDGRGREPRLDVRSGRATARRSNDGGMAVTLAEGDVAIADGHGGLSVYRIPARHSDWTQGMLSFDRTTLADVVAEANRYSRRPIVVRPEVAAMRVSGAVKAGNTEALAKSLAAAFDLKLEKARDGRLVLSAKRSVIQP